MKQDKETPVCNLLTHITVPSPLTNRVIDWIPADSFQQLERMYHSRVEQLRCNRHRFNKIFADVSRLQNTLFIGFNLCLGVSLCAQLPYLVAFGLGLCSAYLLTLLLLKTKEW